MTSAASLEFVMWLVATTGLYWLSPQRLRRYLLMLSTVVVLAAVDLSSLFALLAMTAVVCLVTQVKGAREPVALLSGCAAVVAALVVFKLLDANSASASITDRLVPLGLSYYSLRCVHLLMERYLERIVRPTVAQVFEYLFFPATIIAGPINRFPDYISENTPAFEFDKFSEALERILYGYVKIVVLSNYLLSTKFFPWAMSLADPATAQYQYLDALDYGLTLYLQFSGYSDIAIGFALLLGHRIIENFSWPFLKSNIAEFWRSWHISLTRLCREYVFTSVHAATRRAWVGVLATMLAISLWHGLTANYLAWGLYHATGLVIYRAWSGSSTALFMRERLSDSLNYLIGWFVTFQFVILGFVFTKEDDLTASLDAWVVLIKGVFGNV
jgi:D-alanyl-lipoteichoic acid acyltransferase DltB (MBOAT superfamily)